MERNNKRRYIRLLAVVFAIAGFILLILPFITEFRFRNGLLMLMISGAFGIMSHQKLKSFSFTAWVLVCVDCALAFPGMLIQWGGFELSLLIVPLTQIIMFGMGTTLSLSDFSRILISPWPVFVGVILQFGLMPLVGFIIAKSMGFDGELAAGIILIGSVSGGVASNLMAFIAGANVALSVTMTVVSTFIAPLATPLLMSVYAGSFIPVDTVAMMIGVINIIVIPVVAGLAAHSILYSRAKLTNDAGSLIVISALSLLVMIFTLKVNPSGMGVFAPLRNGIILGGVLILIVSLSKLIVSVWLGRPNIWVDKSLPLVSMAGICAILAIIIAQTHDVLMEAGILLVAAAVIHNFSGYFLGYWGGRGAGIIIGKAGYKLGFLESPLSVIDEVSCRTIAFEVGMQNGGMATGLAMDVFRSHVAALPPNLFGTWMNISGSVLANWWKRKGFRK
ncbi:MAG: bile acid:sodium symporter family protein [Prolixibacteraceae bacterium]|nr:bile acid:sodium symporter family protein [Prolixibacteraceae bacterium]